MKNTLILLLTILISNSLFCQTPQNSEPNKIVIRLTILNDNGDLLMKKSDYGWMTIATFHTERQNINQVIDSLSKAYGITISKPNLAGVFTYQYKFKKSSDTRLIYRANFIKGDIKSAKGNHNLTWLPQKEAIQKLKTTVSSLGEMTEQVLKFPETIWGGSFLLDRDKNWKLSSKVVEEFHSIRDVNFTSLETEAALVKKHCKIIWMEVLITN